MRRGDLGIGVCCLQGLLTRFGLDPGEIHGVFGIRTASALLAFQSSAGIETDCLAGRETLSALCTQLS